MVSVATHIRQALGAEPADLVIENVKILDVVRGEIYTSKIAINSDSGVIVGTGDDYKGRETIDGTGLTAVPGFIDAHTHIESSLLTPMEFDRCVLRRGTTSVFCDPHEMGNVMGTSAVRYFQRAAEIAVTDIFVNVPSCVPATPLETSGAHINVDEMEALTGHSRSKNISEFMDIGGIMTQNPATMEKLERFKNRSIDGHLPDMPRPVMVAAAACGVRNDHETSKREDLVEKQRLGLTVHARGGSVCNNLESLALEFNEMNSIALCLCTDDRNPRDIRDEGHIDHAIRTIIRHGGHVAATYRAASLSAAMHYGLDRNTEDHGPQRGKIAPGWKADIVLIEGDLKDCKVHSVIKSGKLVTPETFAARPEVPAIGYNSVHIVEIKPEDLVLKRKSPTLPVIEIVPGNGAVTTYSTHCLPVNARGELQRDIGNDILMLDVLERHGHNGNKARWPVKGFGFKEGAIASTIGHDSHNITIVSASDEAAAIAANHLKKTGGGIVVVKDGKVIGELPLPIAGLMSDKPFEVVCKQLDALHTAIQRLNPAVADPKMYMGFLPLCVIPKLKLTDFGPVRFDPAAGDTSPVLIEDQRKAARPHVRPQKIIKLA